MTKPAEVDPTLTMIASRLFQESMALAAVFGMVDDIPQWWKNASEKVRTADLLLREVVHYLVLPAELVTRIEEFLAD